MPTESGIVHNNVRRITGYRTTMLRTILMTNKQLTLWENLPLGKYEIGTIGYSLSKTRLNHFRKQVGDLSLDIPHFSERCYERKITDKEIRELLLNGEVVKFEVHQNFWEIRRRERYVLQKRINGRFVNMVFEIQGDSLIGITAYVK